MFGSIAGYDNRLQKPRRWSHLWNLYRFQYRSNSQKRGARSIPDQFYRR